MRPEEKQWWRDKQHSDYKQSVDRWHNDQMKRSGGGAGCSTFVLMSFIVILSVVTIAFLII